MGVESQSSRPADRARSHGNSAGQASRSRTLAQWIAAMRLGDVPDDVVSAAKLRILNILGISIAASTRDYGRSVHAAALDLGGSGPCRIFGFGDRTAVTSAAMANGTMASALAFDDSQTETLIHVTATTASTALAMAEWINASGDDVLAAIIAGDEAICRIGAVAPGQFHRHGFHPTGIIGAFGAACVASRLPGLDAAATAHALGVAGTMAAGSNECWRDGTWAQIIDPGWAAQCGITAAVLARRGFSGPAEVFEGAFGLFPSHVQDRGYPLDYARMTRALGQDWESRRISIKPFPCGHVSIPFVECALDLHRAGLRPGDIRRVLCHAAAWIVPVVCEPLAEKRRPRTDWHCRVSLPFTVAEALSLGRLDATSYSEANRSDPAILALADRVDYAIDPDAPRDERYKGWITVETMDGRTLEAVRMHGRDDHMTEAEVLAKLHACLAGRGLEDRTAALHEAVQGLDAGVPVARLMDLATDG